MEKFDTVTPLKKLVAQVLADDTILNSEKHPMLLSWKAQLVEINTGVMMPADLMANHLEMLSILDDGIEKTK